MVRKSNEPARLNARMIENKLLIFCERRMTVFKRSQFRHRFRRINDSSYKSLRRINIVKEWRSSYIVFNGFSGRGLSGVVKYEVVVRVINSTTLLCLTFGSGIF
jgi:hypothetical protein